MKEGNEYKFHDQTFNISQMIKNRLSVVPVIFSLYSLEPVSSSYAVSPYIYASNKQLMRWNKTS